MLRKLPQIANFERPDADDDAFPGMRELDEWQARGVRLAAAPPANATVIDILEPIGRNFMGDGVTVKDVLDKLKGKTGDVIVNINSPGGSYFEGAAIFTALQQYAGKVTVNVLGVAASAASLIMMAGDDIRISPAAGVMIHNAQAFADGDQHDHIAIAETLGQIDKSIRDIYAARTGLKDAELQKMMRPLSGTWLFGKDAVDKGFADSVLGDGDVVKADPKNSASADPASRTKVARAVFQASLSDKGYSRREIRAMIRDAFPEKVTIAGGVDTSPIFAEIASAIRGIQFAKPVTPRADDPATPRAGLLKTLDRLGRAIETTG